MSWTFKKAVYFSLAAHGVVLALLVISPHLPGSGKKKFIEYIPINMVGGGGGGGQPQVGTTPLAKRETLKDLTTMQKAKPESTTAMRYPAETKPKRDVKPKPAPKKAAITKQETPSSSRLAQPGTTLAGGTDSGGSFGTGVRIGTGGGAGGWGPGGPGIGGLGDFPYAYYLNIITEKVSQNWFTSLVDPGVSGTFQTVVYFKIQREGQIVELKVEQSSGVTPLDLSAMRAIRSAAPFPPLPRDYKDPFLVIHLVFENAK